MERESRSSQEYNENEIESELVRAIEQSDFNIGDKVNLILTKTGLKPASEISLIIKTQEGKEVTEHMTEDDIQRHLWIIKELGLVTGDNDRKIVEEKHKTKGGEIKTYKREQIDVLIAKTQEDLDSLIRARKSNDGKLLGKAFGFPSTAIEAWVGKRKKLNVRSLPEEIQQSDAMLFSSPTLSADNWQEEIEYGKKCANSIKSISPVIYTEMLEMMKKKQKII